MSFECSSQPMHPWISHLCRIAGFLDQPSAHDCTLPRMTGSTASRAYQGILSYTPVEFRLLNFLEERQHLRQRWAVMACGSACSMRLVLQHTSSTSDERAAHSP
jgi:hypothetical protein